MVKPIEKNAMKQEIWKVLCKLLVFSINSSVVFMLLTFPYFSKSSYLFSFMCQCSVNFRLPRQISKICITTNLSFNVVSTWYITEASLHSAVSIFSAPWGNACDVEHNHSVLNHFWAESWICVYFGCLCNKWWRFSQAER